VHPLKYAQVERERRWLLASAPELPEDAETRHIVDRYVVGTRLRLREVTAPDGTFVRKLGHKVRVGEGAHEVAHTSLYLDDAEWAVLGGLPARSLTKTRTLVPRGSHVVAVDVHADGTVIAEIDAGDGPAAELPDGWAVIREVTGEEEFTGGALAR
jgi:CYTH domain-containing protein